MLGVCPAKLHLHRPLVCALQSVATICIIRPPFPAEYEVSCIVVITIVIPIVTSETSWLYTSSAPYYACCIHVYVSFWVAEWSAVCAVKVGIFSFDEL